MGWMAPTRHRCVMLGFRSNKGKQITTVGLDIAKQVFQVHGVDAAGVVVLRRQLRRRQVVGFFAKLPRCLIGLEACATAHHWGRLLHGLGHEVRLIPPAHATAYVYRNKTDPADAETICGDAYLRRLLVNRAQAVLNGKRAQAPIVLIIISPDSHCMLRAGGGRRRRGPGQTYQPIGETLL
jgi:Transposase